MGMYSTLQYALQKQGFSEIPMTFKEIEKVLGRTLPASAYKHRPWWANEAVGHSHAKAWLDAGYETAQVDMVGQKLVFRRTKSSPTTSSQSSSGLSERARDFRPAAQPASLFGALKGTFSIEPGWDIAKPALDEALEIDKTADLIDDGLRGAK